MSASTYRSLDQIDRHDADAYGSKAAMLGELSGNGYNVPSGYALPASRFRSFLRANGFPYALEDLAALSAEARELVSGYSLEPDVVDACRRCVADLQAC